MKKKENKKKKDIDIIAQGQDVCIGMLERMNELVGMEVVLGDGKILGAAIQGM